MAIGALRTAIIYLLLIAAMRVMGKRQLGDLQPVELVVTLLVADMAAVAMEDTGAPLLSGLIPIAVLVAMELLLSGLILKFPAAARLVGGRPVIVINNGELDQAAMKKLRLSLEDLIGALRQQGVFDLTEVQYAVAETGGKISVCLKPAKRPATVGDLSLPPPDDGVAFLVISDGKISRRALSMANQTEEWLRDTLRRAKCDADDVFLLTVDQNGRTHLLRKERHA